MGMLLGSSAPGRILPLLIAGTLDSTINTEEKPREGLGDEDNLSQELKKPFKNLCALILSLS